MRHGPQRRYHHGLKRWDADRPAALEALTPMVYGELRKIAAAYLRRERTDHTLQPTALIHEAYLRMVRQESATIQDRSHFYGLAARLMRQILVDTARSYHAEKRGSGNKVQLDEKLAIPGRNVAWDFLALHEALEKLQSHNPRIAQAVELRYFGGLQLEEIAGEIAVSLATVKRDLALGEAWLRRALAGALRPRRASRIPGAEAPPSAFSFSPAGRPPSQPGRCTRHSSRFPPDRGPP
jgi:RNA polymerase sigma factor (TIGR02999 family)